MEYALELNRLVELQMEGSVADYHGTKLQEINDSRCGSERSVCESGSHALFGGSLAAVDLMWTHLKCPTASQDDWRYTPVERCRRVLNAFTPSNETQIRRHYDRRHGSY